MDCERIQKEHLADEYRAGRLSPEEADAYERHYFECDRCFEDLRFRDHLARQLREEGTSLFAAEIQAEERAAVTSRETGKSPLESLRAWWGSLNHRAWGAGLAAALALLVVAFFAYQASDESARIGRVWTPAAHPYVASGLRGGGESQEFLTGIDLYTGGRYGDAARWLRQSAETDPSDGEVQFYLGVSLLLAGRPGEAARVLRTAVQLTPSSSLYQWYLAQADLKRGRWKTAQTELARLAAAGGEFAPEARALLQRIAETRGR